MLKKNIPTSSVCSEDYFYDQDGKIENALAKMETMWSKALKNAIDDSCTIDDIESIREFVISIAGLFSTFFGFMFGSIFGFEDVIQARWLRPVDAMTNLPFIGQLNTVFVVAIAFGMGLNILVMIFNVINSIKSHDVENMLFSHNGIAGLVFYGFLVLTIVLYMTGHKVPGNILMVIFLGVPVILFVFKEPLGNLVTKQHKKMEEGKVMFFVQAFFELFETMLSYFSNTISYVRIGAFAVSHAAMMEVVLMLSGASAGHTNWIVFVLGNVLVCGLEGLVVGIQVLRLEY